MEQAIFQAKPHKTILEDGSALWALELPDGTGLYKPNSLMVDVGTLNDMTVYHWISEGAQLEAIKASGYLGSAWSELSDEAYNAVMEINITEEVDGETVTTRMKLVDANAAGISYTAKDVLPPHQWEGWE